MSFAAAYDRLTAAEAVARRRYWVRKRVEWRFEKRREYGPGVASAIQRIRALQNDAEEEWASAREDLDRLWDRA